MMLFEGCATALITPFQDGAVDYAAMGRMIETQLAAGVRGFVVCGTTGEPATLTHDEYLGVIRFCIERVRRRVPVIAGAGTNCTATSIANALECEALGADGLLVVTPYYNKCTQNGLIAHYRAVCSAVHIPVIAYNVPPRTGVNVQPKTYYELQKIENLAAVKEASSNYLQIIEVARITKGKLRLYSGDDEMVAPFYPLGGAGVISVAANVIPDVMAEICRLSEQNKLYEAQQLADRYADFNKLLFCEVNPIPVKAAASLLGLCRNELRLPLTPMEDAHFHELKAEMKKLGLLS